MKFEKFFHRVKKLQHHLSLWDAGGCLVERPVDLFYLTGLTVSMGALVVVRNEVSLFVDGRYLTSAKQRSPFPVYPLEELVAHLGGRMALDAHQTSIHRLNQLSSRKVEWIPVASPLKSIRGTKETGEIESLQKSSQLLGAGFSYLKRILKAGMTEQQAAWKFESFCRIHGAERLSFDPIVAFGKNSCYPHHRSGNALLHKGDIVLCDLGVVVDGYHSDMTRTWFFGKQDSKLVELNSIVKAAHEAALRICRPGIAVGALDEAACTVIEKAGFQELICHSLGHGIGLEIHEFPRIKSSGEDSGVLLEEGMVITIEPGLYWAGVGGVRQEDTIVITRDGFCNFYEHIPK